MAPKRAFGGVMRPFGGGFRGPNRERASVFSGAGRGRAGGSAVEPGRDQRVQRRGTGRCRWFCGGARRRSQRVQRRRTGAVQGVLRWSRGGASAFSGGARCGTGAEQAGVLRRRRGRGQRVQRRGIGAGRGVQRCRRDGPAAGSQKKCSEGKMRPPPGSQFSAARVPVLSRRGHSSQPSGVSAVRSPELAVPAARPLRRRGHSTTTSVWPSTCNWRISCVELT